jgi:hypothetical protein
LGKPILFFDESRFGTKSKTGLAWYEKGSRTPIKVKLGFKNFYLYSSVNHDNGNNIIPNPIFKYSIGYSNSNFIFLVKKSSKSLSCMDIQLHFLKIFITKIVSLP